MSNVQTPITKEQLLEQIGKLIYQYEEDTNQNVVGALITFYDPDTQAKSPVYEWRGDVFIEKDANIKIALTDSSDD